MEEEKKEEKKEEALSFISATFDNWQDTLGEKLFKLKDEVLRKPLIPELLRSKARNVALWQKVETVMGRASKGVFKVIKPKLPKVDKTAGKIIELYRTYENDVSVLKLQLSQSPDLSEVVAVLQELANLEEQRQKRLLALAKEWATESLTEVKKSDDIHSGEILTELKQFDSDRIIEKKDLALLPFFEKDLVRILKFQQ